MRKAETGKGKAGRANAGRHQKGVRKMLAILIIDRCENNQEMLE